MSDNCVNSCFCSQHSWSWLPIFQRTLSADPICDQWGQPGSSPVCTGPQVGSWSPVGTAPLSSKKKLYIFQTTLHLPPLRFKGRSCTNALAPLPTTAAFFSIFYQTTPCIYVFPWPFSVHGPGVPTTRPQDRFSVYEPHLPGDQQLPGTENRLPCWPYLSHSNHFRWRVR